MSVARRTPSRMETMTFSVRCTSYSGREARAVRSSDFIANGVPVRSFALGASIVRDGIRGRPGQQDRIAREIDAVRPVGGVEDQATLVARARRGDARDLQTPQLDQGPPLGPQRGDVVRRVAGLGHLQEQPERHRAGPEPAVQLFAPEARVSLPALVTREKGLPS